MPKTKDSGLLAIARSNWKTSATKQPEQKPVSESAFRAHRSLALPDAALIQEKPPLELEGSRRHKTSLSLDVGLWNCISDTAHLVKKRLRAMGKGQVNPVDILEAAFIKFHELPLGEQIELVRRYRDR